jgi:NADPH:quinone reductase-like Zn-dependent oxidoreductase
MTQLMRAMSPTTWGPPEVLTEVRVPRPVPGPTEVLVRVRAAGVNPTDWKARATGGLGLWGDPPILGYDVSGVVEEVGFGVQNFRAGDEVFGMPRFPHQAGGYAEYVAAPSRQFALKPAELDHVQAAALPLAALTAWQSLVDMAGLRAGQRVLVHAAAGGVGHLAVQIAAALGAAVIGTASAPKHALLRKLGADELIDYRTADFVESCAGLDVVLDPVGGEYGLRSLRVLRTGGTMVALAGALDQSVIDLAEQRGVRAGFLLVEPDSAGLASIAGLVAAGKLRPEIETVLPLEQAAKAHELGETGRVTGKIVLALDEWN